MPQQPLTRAQRAALEALKAPEAIAVSSVYADGSYLITDDATQAAPAAGGTIGELLMRHYITWQRDRLGYVISQAGRNYLAGAPEAPVPNGGVCDRCRRGNRSHLFCEGPESSEDAPRWICGSCAHRRMRAINTRELWGRGRRGY